MITTENTSKKTPPYLALSHASRTVVLLIFAGLVNSAHAQVNKSWINAASTWPPTTASQEWYYDNGANWNDGTLPAAGDFIRLTSPTATNVYLNNTVSGIHSITMNNGNRLYLGANAELSTFTNTNTQILLGDTFGTPSRNDAELYIEAGAKVLLDNSINISYGSA